MKLDLTQWKSLGKVMVFIDELGIHKTKDHSCMALVWMLKLF